ncbi:phage major capsid protein [uncultured Reyranella sp.]|uniref:phage major capsid protein n=1 Tax=uncultured Reyranella sp. TaxID=735512 RepID=UPI00259CB59F|nr:phage major capsid protein [uncultured Reyranella sp.]
MPGLGAPEFTELFATTLEKYESELIDNVLTSHPTLDLFRKNAKSANGRSLVIPLRAARLSRTSVTDASGTFSTSVDGKVVGAAVYKWSRPIVTPTRVEWEELQQNTGEQELIDLLKAHKDTAVDDHATFLAQGLHAPTPASGMFQSLATIVSDTGTIGDINPSLSGKEYWRSPVHQSDSQDESIVKAFRTLENDIIVGTAGRHRTDAIVAGRDVYEEYVDYMDDKVRYVNAEGGQTKFKGVYFGDIEVRLDPDCAPNTAYFLDTKTWRFRFLNGNLMKVQPSQSITGTLDFVTPVASMVSVGVDERRANGKLVRTITPDPEPAP